MPCPVAAFKFPESRPAPENCVRRTIAVRLLSVIINSKASVPPFPLSESADACDYYGEACPSTLELTSRLSIFYHRTKSSMAKVLWVGGSSALARSYFDEVHPAHRQRIQLIAAAPTPPNWPLPDDVPFVELDMASAASVRTVFQRLPSGVDSGIDAIIFGVRASLVWGRPEEHETLSKHLDLLVRSAAAAGCTCVLHISSIAVTDHVATQVGEASTAFHALPHRLPTRLRHFPR